MFKLPDLPYAYDALQPAISAETMRLHHDKHHAKYVETTNQLCQDEGLSPESLEWLVASSRQPSRRKLHNNAAQAWNHAFFWSCMTPGGGTPDGELAKAIDQDFGSLDGLKTKFLEQGEAHFGSGWVWLLEGPDGLKVQASHDAENHLGASSVTPLITCDLWEHAYYVDYRNDRSHYLNAWFDQVVDWKFAGHQSAAVRGEGQAWRYPDPEFARLSRQA